MAFPQTVLPVRVRIAPGGTASDPASWVWVDITQWVRVESGIVIEEGKPDEASRVDPGKATLTLDNRDGRFSSRNVLGPWWGKLAKRTPLRIGTIAVTDTFNRTTANGWGTCDTGQAWTTTGAAADWLVSPSGGGQVLVQAANTVRVALLLNAELLDIDATFVVSVPAVMTGASMVCAFYLRYIDSNNFYLLSVEFDPGGTLTAKIRRVLAGTLTDLAVLQPIPSLTYTGGQQMAVRVQGDGSALRIKVWPGSGSQPDPWTLTAADDAIPGAGLIGFYLWCVAGNTNSKPFAVAVDALEVESVEFTGRVPKWPPRWDKSGKDATTPITAMGLLSFLQQSNDTIRSAITRMILGLGPIELWPFEDDSDATQAASALDGGLPATVRALQFAQTTPALLGAQQTAGVTASTVVTFKVRAHVATGTWAVVWFAQLLAPPAATTVIMSVNSSGTVRRWDVALDSTSINLLGYNGAGTLLASANVGYGTLLPPIWVAFDLLVDQSGGNIDAKLLMYAVDPNNLGAAGFFGVTVAGVVGSPSGGRFEGSLGYNGGRIGAISVFNTEPSFVSGTFFSAANGYVGELAADRVGRLCAEQGVQVLVEEGESEPMGPQRVAGFVDLLYSCEDADLGILYERGGGLAYRPRGARYNRDVELALDFTPGDVADAPEPDEDDRFKNRWVVTRDGGSSATAEDTDSIVEHGLAEQPITINVVRDDVLLDHATFRLRTTTVDEYKWPEIRLDLARNTGQIRTWRRAAPWPRMTIDHEPAQIQGNNVDLTVYGQKQTMGPYEWTIALNAAPTSPWRVAEIDDPDTRIDTDGSQMAANAASNATSLLVATTAGELWTTDPADFPFDVRIAGVRITVTAITGSTSPQTFNVVRLVDGFDKSLFAGDDVRLWAPSYIAL